MLATACPRDTGNGKSSGENGVTSSTTEQGGSEAETPATPEKTEAENPCETANPCAENPCESTNPCTENPCGENPCEANPCGENPCEANPCGENAAAENPCETSTKAEGDVVNVILQTSKGKITIAVHKDWSPLGAAHFLELVRDHYYDGAPWFRVMPGFMAQAGIAADPQETAKWQEKTIPDEPVVKGNLEGYVSFGRSSQPNSRSTHFFINYVDNSRLDAQGFPAFGEVIDGMDVARNLFPTGDRTVNQGELSQKGIDYFKQIAPDGDVIEKAWVEGEE